MHCSTQQVDFIRQSESSLFSGVLHFRHCNYCNFFIAFSSSSSGEIQMRLQFTLALHHGKWIVMQTGANRKHSYRKCLSLFFSFFASSRKSAKTWRGFQIKKKRIESCGLENSTHIENSLDLIQFIPVLTAVGLIWQWLRNRKTRHSCSNLRLQWEEDFFLWV